jgi:hypothetical protein
MLLYMPYWMAITPDGKYGIHELPEWPGGYKEGANHLGRPVSHGCVRLGVGAAKTVYEWASEGTTVVVHLAGVLMYPRRMPGCSELTRSLAVLEFWCFAGGPKEAFGLSLPIRACSKVVLRSIRIAESGVRFSSGPQNTN